MHHTLKLTSPVIAFTALAAFACGSDDSSPTTQQMPALPGMNAGGTPGTSNPPEGQANGPGGTNEGQGPIDIAHPTASVEDRGEDCQISGMPASAELQNQLTLPDPFLGLNGQRLTSKSQWRCRREEIRKLGESFIYGSKPSKPESVSGEVTPTSITVNLQNQGLSASFTATITLPPGASGPVPAIIGYGGSSFQQTILDEGVAFINYSLASVGDETTKTPSKAGAFYAVNPDREDTGMLVAWAWGVSRMIDVLESSDSQLINPKAIGVHGCSRSGKGARSVSSTASTIREGRFPCWRGSIPNRSCGFRRRMPRHAACRTARRSASTTSAARCAAALRSPIACRRARSGCAMAGRD